MPASDGAAHSLVIRPEAAVPDRDVPAQRREFKYHLPLSRLSYLQRYLEPHCTPDPFAGPDGTYLIRSLYLDTWDFRLYRANEREAGARYKARIRTYPSQSGSPVFFEIKGRVLDAILKTRARVPGDRWQDYLRLDHPATGTDPALTAFLLKLHQHSLQPTTLVQYARYAYAGIRESYARVSVDVQIQAQERRHFDLEGADGSWRAIDNAVYTVTPEAVAVLELKFSGPPPRWMQNLVRELNLTRHSFSKYGNSMLAWYLPPHADSRRSRRRS